MTKKYCYLILSLVVFICAVFFYSPVSAEQPQDDSTLQKNKKEIIKDIEMVERGLHSTKGCISEAKSSDELERCRMDDTTIKFQKVQDSLSEMGMTPEERRLKRLRRE